MAVAQAGRGRVYWAPYAHGPGGWGPQEPYALSTIEMANTVVLLMAFAGELTEADQERFNAGSQQVILLSPGQSLRRAATSQSWPPNDLRQGKRMGLATLCPIYLQQPDGKKGNFLQRCYRRLPPMEPKLGLDSILTLTDRLLQIRGHDAGAP